MLVSLGCAVVDSVSSLRAALNRAGTTEAQVAVLDVNLRGKSIFPVAEILRGRGIPIVFSTGYGFSGIESKWKTYPVIQKPFLADQLEAALLRVAAQSRSGSQPE